MTDITPDHIWTAAWGVGMGTLIAAPGAIAAAANASGAARKAVNAIAVSLAISLSNTVGCVAGFESVWRLSKDVSSAGLGAVIGAIALSALAYIAARPFAKANPPESEP